jgi:hypothetical protein
MPTSGDAVGEIGDYGAGHSGSEITQLATVRLPVALGITLLTSVQWCVDE